VAAGRRAVRPARPGDGLRAAVPPARAPRPPVLLRRRQAHQGPCPPRKCIKASSFDDAAKPISSRFRVRRPAFSVPCFLASNRILPGQSAVVTRPDQLLDFSSLDLVGFGVLLRLISIKKDADLVASHNSFGPFFESGIPKLDLEALPCLRASFRLNGLAIIVIGTTSFSVEKKSVFTKEACDFRDPVLESPCYFCSRA
jgi:hypothetical protein